MQTIEEVLALLDSLDGAGIVVTDSELVTAELVSMGYEHETDGVQS